MSGGSVLSGRVHVLLVEDDEHVSAMYRARLEMDGFRVLIAADGEAGLRIAQTSPPDLLILDYRLPRLDGATFLRRLRADERTQDLRVIVLSAFSDARLMDEARALGALRWLVKTRVTPAELSAVVRELVQLELGLQG